MKEAETRSDDDVPSRFSVDLTGRTLLGVYRVECLLAKGGMGSLYLARDTNLGRTVVVKVPHPRFLGESGFRARFRREVDELVRLEHPRVVRILARGEWEEIPFFVIQYLGGGTLEERVANAPGGRISADEVVPLLVAMGETLDFVHSRGTVHRDVKPANVLFDESGHVFLSDFGVAKVLEADGGVTGTGIGIGSPLYMAPEQARGRGVGPAADQYSLAATFHYALTGKPPFGGDTPLLVVAAKCQEDAPDVREEAPDVPAGAALALARALSRDPEERFESCAAFADAFREGVEESRRPAAAAGGRPLLFWVLFPAVFVLGLLLFRLLGDGEQKPPGDDPGADATATAIDEPAVVLLDPGVEPRKEIRYRPEPGERFGLSLLFTSEQRVEAPGLPGAPVPSKFEVPDGRVEAAVAITKVDPDGTMHWTLTVEDVQGLPAGMSGGLEESVGQTLAGEASARGIESGEDGERPPSAVGVLHASGNHLLGAGALVVPLPEEPVGVGARWKMPGLFRQRGLEVAGTGFYELVSREEGRLEIAASFAMTAPAQDFPLPEGAPPAAKVRMHTLHVSAEGTIVLDGRSPIPVSREEAVTIRIEAASKGMKQPAGVQMDMHTRTERR